MKAALIAVNAKFSHSNLALLYLRKALQLQGTSKAELIEWNINRSASELLEILIEGEYNYLLFSAYIWNTTYLAALLPDLRRLLPDAVILMGGPEAVHRRDFWTASGSVDVIVHGMAEDLAEILKDQIRQDKTRLLSLPRRPFCETPFPYDETVLKELDGRLLYYESSRGCLFNCAYCLSARDDQKPDYRRTDQIEKELKLLVTYPGTVKFVDRTFNANSSVSRFIWTYLAENPPAGCFHFEIHPLLLKEEDFSILERLEPGSVQFEAGIQSTDGEILNRINRKGDWPREKEAIRRLIGLNRFHIHLDQIVGLPGDTPSTAGRSLDEILSLNPDNFQLGFLKILPGTPLADRTHQEGLSASAAPPYELLCTKDFPFRELSRFHRMEVLIDIFHNRGYFPLTLPLMARAAGGHYAFFSGFLKREKPEMENRKWEYWGELLYRYAAALFPQMEIEIVDSLRQDWCPRAKAQYYPPFLEYDDQEEIRTQRLRAGSYLARTIPGLKKSELNRAILFLPRGKVAEKREMQIFLRRAGTPQKITVKTDDLEPADK